MKKRTVTLVVAALLALVALVTVWGSAAAAGPRDSTGAEWGRRGLRETIEEVAGLLDMTPRELRRALRDGEAIAGLADERGVSALTVVDTIVADRAARIEALLDQGLLTQPQAGVLTSRLRQRATDVVTLPFPYGLHGSALRTAAGTVGISAEELITELDSGETIGEVAEDHGSTAEAVVAALVEAKEQSLRELLSLDLMTETQASVAMARYRSVAERAVSEGAPRWRDARRSDLRPLRDFAGF